VGKLPLAKPFQAESLRRVMRDVLQETAPPAAQLSDVKSPCKNAIWLPLPFTLCVGFSRSHDIAVPRGDESAAPARGSATRGSSYCVTSSPAREPSSLSVHAIGKYY
jgi:hypothetical protein